MICNPILLCAFFGQMLCCNASVIWRPLELPIVFGRNFTLYCNTTTINNSEATWMKESDVIAHQGLVFYRYKYAEYSTNDGSFLTIMDTNVSDLDVSYTCISDIFSYERVLELRESNYIVFPTEGETNISWSSTCSTNNNCVNISFQRIYPIPKCELRHNNRTILTTQSINSNLKGIYYYATISLANLQLSNICGGYLELSCTLQATLQFCGGRQHLQQCPGKSSETQSDRYILFASIVTVSVLAVIAIVGSFLYKNRKAQSHQEYNDNYEDQEPLRLPRVETVDLKLSSTTSKTNS